MDDCKTLGYIIRRARQARGLSQRALAVLARITQASISRYESNVQYPAPQEWSRLAPVLELSPRLLNQLKLPRKRATDLASMMCAERPRYYPRGDRESIQRLLRLRRVDRKVFDALWKELHKRQDWLYVRAFLLTAQTDSRREIEAWMRHLTTETTVPCRLSTLRCGYRDRPHVNPATRQMVGDLRVPALVRTGNQPGVIFPQVNLLVGDQVMRVDALVGLRVGKVTRFCVAEIDGEGHDAGGDGDRARLGLPVVRFTWEQVRSDGFVAAFWERVTRTLCPRADAQDLTLPLVAAHSGLCGSAPRLGQLSREWGEPDARHPAPRGPGLAGLAIARRHSKESPRT